MSVTSITDGASQDRVAVEALAAGRLSALAPRPNTLAATGLSAELLGDLASKLLLRLGVLSTSALVERLGVAGGVLADVLALLRREARIEVRAGGQSELAYALS